MITKARHFYSDEWCTDKNAMPQAELQKIAKQIRENCTCEEIFNYSDYTCSTYVNENLGVKYWVKDAFGHISEIDEVRAY